MSQIESNDPNQDEITELSSSEKPTIDASDLARSRHTIPPLSSSSQDLSYFGLKNKVQRRLLTELDPNMDITRTDEVRRAIIELFEQILAEEGFVLSRPERARLFEQIAAEILGFGPLQTLLEDDTISEILVNGPNKIYIERKGRMHRVPLNFDDNDHLMRIIDRIISPLGRHIDETNPFVSARLPDGSRVNAAIPPFSIYAPTLMIRKFSRNPLTVENLVQSGSITHAAIQFLKVCMETRLNIIITGDEGSGKTTLLNVLSSFIPSNERIITVEQTVEFQLRSEHVITLEAIHPDLDGRNGVNIGKLLMLALRLRPDRIALGEISNEFFLATIQAMNSTCFMSTMPASSCKDCLDRLVFIAVELYPNENRDTLLRRLLGGVNILVHCMIDKDGKRQVDEIAAVEGEGRRQLITVFKSYGDRQLTPTKTLPWQTLTHFRQHGVYLPSSVFDAHVA